MSKLKEHAHAELERAGLFDDDGDYSGMIGQAVYELIDVFSKQGHSGLSANMTVDLFRKLALFEPITPVTGEEEEWQEVSDELWQNKRDSRLFKSTDDKVRFLDAIIWKTQSGVTYSGTADGINSKLAFKNFPMEPKTFIIEVEEEEVEPDRWLFHIKNNKDLEKVWEIYIDPRDEDSM